MAHAAPPGVAVAADGTITITVGAYEVKIGKDVAPLRACAVQFFKACEGALRLARAPQPAGS